VPLPRFTYSKPILAFCIAFAFHFFGYIGMQNNIAFFYNCTPLHILVCSCCLLYTHPIDNNKFYIFAILAFCIGFGAEWIGVNTGFLFGDYWYGKVMGWGIGGVPFSIGLNWFTVLYCCGVLAQQFFSITNKPSIINGLLFSAITATLATLFDYCIEPGATKLLFWSWQNNSIPTYNYICWWGCSFVIAYLFYYLIGSVKNNFAIWLLAMQLLFFILMK
jgi:bisanhydrobacterioruberin hydratase